MSQYIYNWSKSAALKLPLCSLMILDEQVLHVVDSVCPCSVCFSLSHRHTHTHTHTHTQTHTHSYAHTILFPSEDHMLCTAEGQPGQVDFFDLRLRVIICPRLRSTCFFFPTPVQHVLFSGLWVPHCTRDKTVKNLPWLWPCHSCRGAWDLWKQNALLDILAFCFC